MIPLEGIEVIGKLLECLREQLEKGFNEPGGSQRSEPFHESGRPAWLQCDDNFVDYPCYVHAK